MTTSIKRTMIALAITTFGLSGAALAAPPSFEAVDTNQDGMISPSEAGALEGLDFAAADVNGDGALSPEEYEAAAARMQ